MDDISRIREFYPCHAREGSYPFQYKAAYWYVPKEPEYGQGNSEYAGENVPFGATFTYYLKDSVASLASLRKLSEKGKTSVPFPGWDALEAEKLQQQPRILLTVRDATRKSGQGGQRKQ